MPCGRVVGNYVRGQRSCPSLGYPLLLEEENPFNERILIDAWDLLNRANQGRLQSRVPLNLG